VAVVVVVIHAITGQCRNFAFLRISGHGFAPEPSALGGEVVMERRGLHKVWNWPNQPRVALRLASPCGTIVQQVLLLVDFASLLRQHSDQAGWHDDCCPGPLFDDRQRLFVQS
jgi:hypothetical protein